MHQRIILVVEDNEDCRELLVFQLRRVGYNAIEADTGAKGLEKAVSELPDLIIMDLGLPVIDGIEATRRLKEEPKTRHIPIIVHTAWQEEDRKKKALEAGADQILTKPVSPRLLQETVQVFLGNNSRLVASTNNDAA